MGTLAFCGMKHEKKPSRELSMRILEEAGSPTVPILQGTRPCTDADRTRYLQLIADRNFGGSFPGFEFQLDRIDTSESVRLNVALNHLGEWALERRTIRIKPFSAEPWGWLTISQANNCLHPGMDFDAEWFLDRVKPFVPIFEPAFMFADSRDRMFNSIGDDPQRVAWPLMIIGPMEVARRGRQHVLATPAWRVEELPYGGIWVQAARNPFIALRKDVDPIARHLDLVPVGDVPVEEEPR